jgi:hypothetical protein
LIKKVKEGYRVVSEKGKNLGGPYRTRGEAEKRLRQVEFFKHKSGSGKRRLQPSSPAGPKAR